MNLKIVGMISAMALSFAMAQENSQAAEVVPAETSAAEVATAKAPVENVSAQTPAAETTQPAAESAEPVVESAPVAEPAPTPVASVAPTEEIQTNVAVAPKAVRGGDNASANASSELATVESVTAAPKAVRGVDNEPPRTVYYESVYTREDGVPVRTVYVAQRNTKDTTTLDELMGLVPMEFKIGAAGTIGSYYMTGSHWDSDDYNGISWRAGIMSIIPLNLYTMGIKLGVLFEKSEASETYNYYDEKDSRIPVSFSFRQMKIDIPVMFTFKGSTSNLYFDVGTQISIPLKDKLKLSYKEKGETVKERLDLIDDDIRKSVDWSMLFGFSVMANKHLSIDVRADVGLSDLYDNSENFFSLDLSASSFSIGLSLYPF